MTVPSGCDEWTHPPSDDVDLSFGSPPSAQHNKVDLRWCEALNPPEEDQPVILPAGGTSTTAATGESVDLQFGPEPAPAHDVVHLVWGEGATDPDAPPQTSAFYGLGGASQAQAAELARVVADGAEATIQAITTTQSPSNPDDRTPVADADAVAKDWAEQTRRVRLPNDNTDRAPDDMERVVTPQTVQRTLTLDLTKIGALSARIATLLSEAREARRRRINFISRLRILEAIGDNPLQGAWCADYTEGLSGEVATVEVPAEADPSVLRPQIRPGYAGRASFSAARDGEMFHREGQASYQAYFNAAILPGVQRWHPQYRIGTITAIDYDADTCSLTIQGEDSSAQSLIIDPTDLVYDKTDVPIVYMTCNSQPFEVGDRVLVEFQNRDWQQPRVIGFEDNPKPCSIIMAYQLGHFYEGRTFSDPAAPVEANPPRPPDYFRDNGIETVTVSLWREGGLALLFDRNLDQVLAAELISQMPDFTAFDFLGLPAIDKGSFSVPTSSVLRWNGVPQDVPVIGTTNSPTGGVYPNSRPPSPFTLTPTSLEVVCREYWAQNFQYYSYDSLNRVNWSPQVDVAQLAGEVTVTCTLDDFPPEIQWKGTTFHRQEFVNFVPFDFDNNRGADDLWWLDRICISYAPE